MSCLFCKIAQGNIQADVLYEDDLIVVFNDIDPQAPVHFLVIPKKHIPTLNDVEVDDKQLIGHMLIKANEIAIKLGCENGYRLVSNFNEDGGQTVFHIHMHILGKRSLNWPPG